jgi:hypothetical protein
VEIEETSTPTDLSPEQMTEREERVVLHSTRANTSWDELFVFDGDAIRRLTSLVVLAFGILNGLILSRFAFKPMAANPANEFANLIYAIMAPLLSIFQGLTSDPSFGGITRKFQDLIVIAVDAGLGWVIVRLSLLLFARLRVQALSAPLIAGPFLFFRRGLAPHQRWV